MDKAMDAYLRGRIYGILEQVGKIPSAAVLALWHEVLDDMYGDEGDRKNVVQEIALKDDKLSDEAKSWLKSLVNPEK